MTATEAARKFSDVLSRVAAGEEIEIIRNGVAVAVIAPPRARFVSADRFRDLLETAPEVDEAFAEDLRKIRAEVGAPEDAWRS
jgi:prevent-host-death family protein